MHMQMAFVSRTARVGSRVSGPLWLVRHAETTGHAPLPTAPQGARTKPHKGRFQNALP